MSWWDRYKEAARQQLLAKWRAVDEEAAKLDKELEERRGIGAAIVRGLYKGLNFIGGALAKGFFAIFPNAPESAEMLLSGEMLNIPKEAWERAIESVGVTFGLDKDTVDTLKTYYQGIGEASPVVRGLCLIGIYMAIFQWFIGPGLGKATQRLFADKRPAAPDPGVVMGARALDPELDKRIWDALERNGYTEQDIELMFAATYQRIPLEVLRDIYYREGKDVAWLDHRLEELGFTPERREEIKTTFPLLPSLQDLIMLQAKEAFEEDQVKQFGLDAEPPGDILEYTRKIGLSDDLTKRYWRAHWVHPSYQQVMEMLHRGVIDWDTVYQWYRLVEIPPFWREAMTKIGYNPYTRVDVRRMHLMGVVSDEELLQAYKDLGYDDTKAANMALFTKRYNTRQEQGEYRDVVIKRYRDGAIDHALALQMLVSTGISEDRAGYILAKAQYDEWLEQQQLEIENIQMRYQARIIDRRSAHDALDRLGLPAKQTENYLLKWDKGVRGEDKFPSKTDLDKFFHKGIIKEDEWRYQMDLLGYKRQYIDWYYKEMTTPAKGG